MASTGWWRFEPPSKQRLPFLGVTSLNWRGRKPASLSKGWTGVTRREGEAMWFIDRRIKSSGVGPSVREVAAYLGCSISTADHTIVSLHEKRLINCLPGRARAVELKHGITQLTD